MRIMRKTALLLAVIMILATPVCFAQGTVYTVRPGDTLSKIAAWNNLTVSDLISANPSIKSASMIYVGQKITIPTTKFVKYTVQRGDTFYGIAARFQISATELKKANPQITNIAWIYVGQVIMVPDTKSLTSYEQQVFELVNKERSARGLGTLTYNSEVARCARFKSEDMIDKGYFSHTSPTYGSPFNMMEDFGIRFSNGGENIAYGQRTAAEVMNSWMNSAGHKANILSAAYTQMGVGVAKASNGTLYWTQLFIKPY